MINNEGKEIQKGEEGKKNIIKKMEEREERES